MEQVQKCVLCYVVIVDDVNYKLVCELVFQYGVDVEIFFGVKVLEEVFSVFEVDVVMVVIVGVVGFLFILVVVKVGKWVLFVNKEVLVMFGVLFIEVVN